MPIHWHRGAVSGFLLVLALGVQIDYGRSGVITEPFTRSLLLPRSSTPHVIAHRGASGYLPEHTLQAYRLAIDMGVHYVEPDLVLTKDGHLVCRHDVDLTHTTDVAQRPEFRDRKRNLTLSGPAAGPSLYADGQEVRIEGFFSFDFTLAELKTLKAKQRLGQRTTAYDGLFQIPTFEEVVDMVREAELATGRPIGIYAELKEPYFFKQQGFDMEGILIKSLQAKDFPTKDQALFRAKEAADSPQPLIIQCFDSATLCSLAEKVPHIPRVQLLLAPAHVDDSIGYHTGRSMIYHSELPLKDVAAYAQGIGPPKSVYMKQEPKLSRAMVEEAHAAGLAVHPYTFRREEAFVDKVFQGDSEDELRFFYEWLGVDGLFVEFPDQAALVIQAVVASPRSGPPSLGEMDKAYSSLLSTFDKEGLSRLESQVKCMFERKVGSMDCEGDMSWNPRWLRSILSRSIQGDDQEVLS